MYRYLILTLAIIASISGGYFWGSSAHPPTPVSNISAIRQPGDFHYTNPLLECETGSDIAGNLPLKNLKDNLTKEIDQITSNGGVDNISIYYRDLNNGPWLGIQEEASFAPASLLKTPVLMAYLKESEHIPDLLDNSILSEDGVEYPIQELLYQMIVDSDNTAFELLATHINSQALRALHQNLGLPFPEEATEDDFISVKQYASLFRLLYNASYLSHHSSEAALTLLSQASYHDGLVAGVEDGVEVAHKYGIRKGEGGQPHELHDCGIIYYPGHPYLLCIMTKGDNIGKLTDSLATLSQLVFQELKSQYPN